MHGGLVIGALHSKLTSAKKKRFKILLFNNDLNSTIWF